MSVNEYTRLSLVQKTGNKMGLKEEYDIIKKDGIRQIDESEKESILTVIRSTFQEAFQGDLEAQDIQLVEGEKPEIKVKGRWLKLEQCEAWQIDHFNYFLFNMSSLSVADRNGFYYVGKEMIHQDTTMGPTRTEFKYLNDKVNIRSPEVIEQTNRIYLDYLFYETLMRERGGSYDYSLNMGTRILRCHVFSVFGEGVRNEKVGFTIRVVPQEIPRLDELNLPDKLQNVTNHMGGLFLVSGRTGDGKSTTVASIINKFNRDQHSRKVITIIEDPIEYVHEPLHAKIIQRRLGDNVPSYARAMSDSLRESTDIVVLGELRERDEIINALRLAEVGKLVIATIHANSVADTVDRFIGEFTSDQKQYRSRLLENLLGILHQNLIVYEGEQYPLSSLLLLEDEESKSVLRKNGFTRAAISELMASDTVDWAVSQSKWFEEQLQMAEDVQKDIEEGHVTEEELEPFEKKLKHLMKPRSREVLLGDYGINEVVDRISTTTE